MKKSDFLAMAKDVLLELEIDTHNRPEEMTLDQWVGIFKTYILTRPMPPGGDYETQSES